MRFMFHLGRRTDHDYMLAIKSKSEQFRARNSIVEAALQTGCEYLFFLDDDHVLEWDTVPGPTSQYDIVENLLAHMEADENLGIVGAVYYHRGGGCRAVVMQHGEQGGYRWIRDDEITGGLQEVAVQGGGCMLLRMSMFDKLAGPWFEPEFDLGTDIQICKKADEAGFKVACDTSIKVGHVMSQRRVITPNNRHQVAVELSKQVAGGGEGVDPQWAISSALSLYRMDAEDYLGMNWDEIGALALEYDASEITKWERPEDYYRSRGTEQLARQVMFHHTPEMVEQTEMFLNTVNTGIPGRGADFGCGSAPAGFELALRGHKMDFVDLDGAGAYEFTKWRAKKRGIECGFTLEGPYDYVLCLDSIEHIQDWQEALGKICDALKVGGALITNYFLNVDFGNPEHVSMDHAAVRQFLVSREVYPVNELVWVKQSPPCMKKADDQKN